MQLTSEQVKVKHLGHLGLVASTIKELGIIDKINQRLPLDRSKGGIVSHGHRTAAMILNGLGFMNGRLYMTPHFFRDKPIAQLLDADITAEHLNEDCLGRCLDQIAAYGVTKLFSEIAFEIAQEKDLLSSRLHLDSTRFSLTGRYEMSAPDGSPQPAHGCSNDHHPDLKQVMLSLVQTGASNIPLWMEAQDGNTSDKCSFHDRVRRVKLFMETVENAPNDLCFIVDPAFYTPEKLAELDAVKWITRVPSTYRQAQSLLSRSASEDTWKTVDAHHQLYSVSEELAGLTQRWVVVHSEKAHARGEKALNRRIEKAHDTLSKACWHLSNQVFSCTDDAQVAVNALIKGAKYHAVKTTIEPVVKQARDGCPSADTKKHITGYRVTHTIEVDAEKINVLQQKLGRFILATNQCDLTILSDHDVLKQYKQQSQIETSFKSMKSDAFELDSFYLKTPKRIGALMMIMTLCLLVCNFSQYKLRTCLVEQNDALPNQLGKPVKNPTINWIAELMVMINVVTLDTDEHQQQLVANVNSIHKRIIAYFGKEALRIYGLPPDFELRKIDSSHYKKLLDWC
jgi:transposase